MRAVFFHRSAILRDSHVDPESDPESWRLTPATLEALRMLLGEDRLLFIFDSSAAVSSRLDHEELDHLHGLVRQVEAGGGRIDALIICPHAETDECSCWSKSPAIFCLPAAQFRLDLATCYMVGDSLRDILAAYRAGIRPMLLLGDRRIKDVCGDRYGPKDCTNVTDLTTAAHDIALEDEITSQIGPGREPVPLVPLADTLLVNQQSLPQLVVTSALARGLLDRVVKTKAQLRDIGRWLSFFVLGAMGLALGIAYLLTHLYRVQPFPQWIYYITLQFIPRPVRGALFIGLGIGIIVLAVKRLYGSTRIWRRPQK